MTVGVCGRRDLCMNTAPSSRLRNRSWQTRRPARPHRSPQRRPGAAERGLPNHPCLDHPILAKTMFCIRSEPGDINKVGKAVFFGGLVLECFGRRERHEEREFEVLKCLQVA